MPIRKRNPKVETLGVTVSIEAKRFVEQEAAMRNASVSEFLRPGVVLGLVQNYLGLSLDEAVARLIQNEASYEDIVQYLSGGESNFVTMLRTRRKQ